MICFKLNKYLSSRILLALVVTNNIFATTSTVKVGTTKSNISQNQILAEVKSIIKLEAKNSNFRKAGYAGASIAAGYLLFKRFYPKTVDVNQAKTKQMHEAQEAAIADLVNFFDKGSEAEGAGKEEIGVVHDATHILTKKSYYFGVMKIFCKFFLTLNLEEKEQLLNNFKKLSQVEPSRGYISSFLHGVWGTATSIGFQIALATIVAWTGRNFYKHFMPLSFEYFITHHTNFDQALEMVNSCTILDTEKAKDDLYLELSKENLKLAYNQLINEGQKVIAFMLYTKIKNKNMVDLTRSTLDNLAENFKNNLLDISNFIETHNLLAIKNRIAAINNNNKMFMNLETVISNG